MAETMLLSTRHCLKWSMLLHDPAVVDSSLQNASDFTVNRIKVWPVG